MGFFITNAWAQDAAPAARGFAPQFIELLPLFLVFFIFYFVFVRPDVKKKKEHKKMVGSLAVRDEIVTNGGLLGKIKEVGDNFVLVEIAKGIEVKVRREAVASTMPKDTIKSL